MKDFEVSIWCVIYNHRDYLKDAIEGFLNQKTEYNFHIYLHDDASDDGTSEIVKDMAQKYPDKITAIIQKDNLYSKHPEAGMGQYPYIKEYVRGKYFALCEGDDFWIDPNKLQIQVDYMENHPECIMTAHNGIIYNQSNGNIRTMSPYDKEQDISIEEAVMWYKGNIPTASIILRTEAYFREGIFNNSCQSGDWIIQLNCLMQGKIHYFDRVMSCYRANIPGSYTVTKWGDIKKRIPIRVSQILFLITYDIYMNKEYHNIIKRKINQMVEYIFIDAGKFTNEEITDIFNGIDYFHENMSDEQHEKYKKYIQDIRDVVLKYKDTHYCSQKTKDIIDKSKRVYIFGAGYYGQIMLSKLLYMGIEVSGVIVSSGQTHVDMLNNIRVYELHEVIDELSGSCVILAGNFKIRNEIRENLDRLQQVDIVEEVYDFDF